MSQVWLILLVTRREVVERLRKKSFRIFSIIIMLMAGAGIVVADRGPDLLGTSTTHLGLVQAQAGEDAALQSSAALQDMPLNTRDYGSLADAQTALMNGDITAFLNGDQLVYDKSEDTTLTAVVNRALYQLQLPGLLQQLGISQEQAAQLLNPTLATVQVQQTTVDHKDDSDRQTLAAIVTIGLYIALALYGNWILTGVVEEKASRVVEVLLGLLEPHDLLAGKTLGILVTAMIQLAGALLGVFAGLAIVGSTSILPSATPGVLLTASVFLLCGLILYSLLFAVVGSTVGRQSEAQTAALPVTLLLLVPYILALTYVPQRPDSVLSRVLSVIPVTSPLVMPARIALGYPSVFELTSALILLVALIVAVAWIGGRVYAGAILTNRQVNLLQMITTLGLRRPSA